MNIADKAIARLESNRGYVCVELNEKQEKQILNLLKKHKVSNIPDKLHVTLMYDEGNVGNLTSFDADKKYKAYISGFSSMGYKGKDEKGDGVWGAFAVILKSRALCKEHKRLLKEGYNHSYPDFVAHMSICYDPTNDDMENCVIAMMDYKKVLIFSNEHSEQIKDD